jgi:hypothetical protein
VLFLIKLVVFVLRTSPSNQTCRTGVRPATREFGRGPVDGALKLVILVNFLGTWEDFLSKTGVFTLNMGKLMCFFSSKICPKLTIDCWPMKNWDLMIKILADLDLNVEIGDLFC